MSAAPASSTAARHHLARRLNAALARDESATTPMVVVDLEAFDANATDLVRRAGDKPVRLASKSLRIPALMQRALAVPGFAGALTYSLREALWLVREGITDDAVMGYPTVDRGALRDLLADADARSRVTLMVDDPAHLSLVEACGDVTGVRVAIDIDAGLRMGRSHVGPKRSPLHDTSEVVAFAQDAIARGFSLVGVMTYEGQVAGVPDDVPNQRARSLVVRKLKAASVAQLEERRAEIAQGLREVVDLEFWNAGGSGSVESTVADPVVTEVAAGSGLLVPGLFDHYESFDPRPAAFYGLPVVRRPGGGLATVAGGGFVASGAVRQGPVADPVGAPGPAPDQPRGSRRGADATHRAGRAAAADRRLGVVPARQVRRARGAHQPGAPAGGRRDRRHGAVVPRPGARLVSPAPSPGPTPAEILSLALDRPPTLGSGRLICVDGPAGSGKTTWAAGIAQLAPEVTVVHMDDLYPGWSGLPEVDAQLGDLLRPLAENQPGSLPSLRLGGRRVRRADRGGSRAVAGR